MRQTQSRPLADALHAWMVLQRGKILDGSAMAKALDYSLRRWSALTRFFDDGQLPIDNNRGGEIRSGPGPLAEPTGYLPARCARASAPRPS